jgi:HAD superfamily hydrolase (TIGR01549 family)
VTATPDTVVIDIDGTLVDTNYHHTLAWYRAFRRYDLVLPVWRLHRAIGMGGDQLVPAVAGDAVEARHGDDLRAAWKEEFDPMLPEIAPFDGAPELLQAIKDRGRTVVLASSGAPDHVEHYLGLFDGRRHAAAWTSSEDVDQTKPEPDLLQIAVGKVGGRSPVVIGDSVWDFQAAQRAGYPGYAIRTGGFSPEELLESGAVAAFESLRELTDALDKVLASSSPLPNEKRLASCGRSFQASTRRGRNAQTPPA